VAWPHCRSLYGTISTSISKTAKEFLPTSTEQSSDFMNTCLALQRRLQIYQYSKSVQTGEVRAKEFADLWFFASLATSHIHLAVLLLIKGRFLFASFSEPRVWLMFVAALIDSRSLRPLL
jgi:hypothetical protein